MSKTEATQDSAPKWMGPSPEQLAAHRISPRFYNSDLAPSRKEGRSWTAYSVFTLWANDVHSLGNYGFALGLFALGLGAWQILVAPLSVPHCSSSCSRSPASWVTRRACPTR